MPRHYGDRFGRTCSASPWLGRPSTRSDPLVGSSTVFPFATAVAEQFGNKSGMATPVVESTGTGGGIKLFCAGVGGAHPDIANASRRIKASEVEECAAERRQGDHRGQDRLRRHRARQRKDSDARSSVTLAADLPGARQASARSAASWCRTRTRPGATSIASLPDAKIEVLGPPPTSGTRDAFVELVMDGGCKDVPEMKALKDRRERQGGLRTRSARTAPISRPARTTT